MEAKIITIKEFKAVGITYFGDNKKGEITKLWDTFNKQYNKINQKSKTMLSYCICDDMPDSEGRFHYTACAEVDSFLDLPEGMVTKVVPEGRYVVYTYSGDLKDLVDFYQNIFTKWLPASGYQFDQRPQFELYDQRFMNNGEFDIYFPIK